MTLIAKTETIMKCSAAHAFAVVTNIEHFGEWFPAIKSIKSVNDLPHEGVDEKYLEPVSLALGGDREIDISVKESIKNASFATEGEFSPLFPRMEVVITETAKDEILLK